mmetsp:Transcript_68234/g.134861  ORF Transcript_68234/g.134861 Transcript_68234/m.134861 type:complete len:138 (+) Transcript_68234:469-882(+)
MGDRASSDGLLPPESGEVICGRTARSFDGLLARKCSRGVCMARAACNVGPEWCAWLGEHAPAVELCALGAGGADEAVTDALKDGICHARDEQPAIGESLDLFEGDGCRAVLLEGDGCCVGNSITDASATSLHCSIGC